MTSSSSMRRALSRPRKMSRTTAWVSRSASRLSPPTTPRSARAPPTRCWMRPAGGASSGQRGAPWAYAVVAAGAVIPLLALVQRVRRDARDGLCPTHADVCPENTDAVVAGGDAALLVLAEVANAAASFLQEEGWEVAYDEDTERPIGVDERSGMSQAAPRAGARAGRLGGGRHGRGRTLRQPLDVDARTNEPRWPVARVVRHVCAARGPRNDRDSRDDHERLDACLSVLDIAVEEGGGDERRAPRAAHGPWRGSQGDLETQTDPNEARRPAPTARGATPYSSPRSRWDSRVTRVDKNAPPTNGASQKKNGCWFSGCGAARCPLFAPPRVTRMSAVDAVESARRSPPARRASGRTSPRSRSGAHAGRVQGEARPRAAGRRRRALPRLEPVAPRTFLRGGALRSEARRDDAAFFFAAAATSTPSRSSHSTPASEIFRTMAVRRTSSMPNAPWWRWRAAGARRAAASRPRAPRAAAAFGGLGRPPPRPRATPSLELDAPFSAFLRRRRTKRRDRRSERCRTKTKTKTKTTKSHTGDDSSTPRDAPAWSSSA